MTRMLVVLAAFWFAAPAFPAGTVLIVADEIPAMQVLADKLKAEEGIPSKIVKQADRPADLAPFAAVIVYIHGKLDAPAEQAFIDYTRAGGKLIVLHHSISSGKRKNKQWFPFLGITLPPGDVDQGGYKWIEPVTLDFVNLAPNHYITTHQVQYPAQIRYRRSDAGRAEERRPGFTLRESEVYLNHTFTGPRTILLGLRYQDAGSGTEYRQDRAGWLRPAGKGWILYFMPGHSARDFRDPTYARILLNAVRYQPSP